MNALASERAQIDLYTSPRANWHDYRGGGNDCSARVNIFAILHLEIAIVCVCVCVCVCTHADSGRALLLDGFRERAKIDVPRRA